MNPSIFVINLDRDVERMAHMHTQLHDLALEYERFSAFLGDALPAELGRCFASDAALSAGEIGCYASHLALMRRMCARGIAYALVLEDDVGLPPDLRELLDAMLKALPTRWDIVRLSYPSKRLAQPIARVGARHALVRYSHVPTSTGAYLVSASGARKFLAERERRLPIDHDLRRVWAWDLDTYGVSPPPIRADVFAMSSIDELTPGARGCVLRSRKIRRQRAFESAARFARGARDFGLPRWITIEALNVAARLTPRRARPAFFAWAERRVA